MNPHQALASQFLKRPANDRATDAEPRTNLPLARYDVVLPGNGLQNIFPQTVSDNFDQGADGPHLENWFFWYYDKNPIPKTNSGFG
jgi:hypothetical protein